MHAIRFLSLGCLAFWALPLAAQQPPRVLDSSFFVTISNEKTGRQDRRETTEVPLIADSACFSWEIELENPPEEIVIVEILQLPAPAGSWGAPGSNVSKDLTAAKTTQTLYPLDGRIGNQWCLSQGDPLGPHAISVTSGGWLDETFQFEVVQFP